MRPLYLVSILYVAFSGWALSCPPPPSQGFLLLTQEQIFDASTLRPISPAFPINIGVQGNYFAPLPGTSSGTVTFFQAYTSGGGYTVSNAKLPATWDIYQTTGRCMNDQTKNHVRVDIPNTNPGATVVSLCKDYESFVFGLDPQTITSVPDGGGGNALTMTGSGINSNNGLPVMMLADPNGGVLWYGNPQSWASDWSWCMSPVLYIYYSGTFYMFVGNQRSDGSFNDGAVDWLGYSILTAN